MFPKRAVASVTGLGGMAGALSGFMFPILTGRMLDHFEKHGHVTAGYGILFSLCASVSADLWSKPFAGARFEPIRFEETAIDPAGELVRRCVEMLTDGECRNLKPFCNSECFEAPAPVLGSIIPVTVKNWQTMNDVMYSPWSCFESGAIPTASWRSREIDFVLAVEPDWLAAALRLGIVLLGELLDPVATTPARKIVPLPNIPNRTFNITNAPYNAVGDGLATNTTAIQNAIKDLHYWPEAGPFLVPAGTFLCGPITLGKEQQPSN